MALIQVRELLQYIYIYILQFTQESDCSSGGWQLVTGNQHVLRSNSSISTQWRNGFFLRIQTGMKGGNWKPLKLEPWNVAMENHHVSKVNRYRPSLYLSISLSILLSIDRSIYLSIDLSVYPSIHPSIDLSIYVSIF